MPVQRKARRLARKSAALLIGLVVVIIAGGVLGSYSLFAHFGVIGTGSDANSASPVRGGTWTDDFFVDPDLLIPNGNVSDGGFAFDQALYLPLFYGDAQGFIHPGAATDIPTVQNGGISADATTWTFHLRPHLVWSDGQPYDARDVDFTWKLWLNPKFGASSTQGFDLISLQMFRRTTSRSPSTSSKPMPRSSRSGWTASWLHCLRTISARWHPR